MSAHRKLFALVLTTAALGLPSVAQALPQASTYGGPPITAGHTSQFSPVTAPSPEVVVTASDSQFSWGDAVIGACIAVSCLLIAGGAVVLVRSNRSESARFHLT